MELFIGSAEEAALVRSGISPEDVRAVFSAGRRTKNIVFDESTGDCVTGGCTGNTTLWVVFREETSRSVLVNAYFHRMQVDGITIIS